MSTIILGLLIFGGMSYVIYSNYIKKGSQGGCDCSGCDCPVKKTKTNSKKSA